MHACAWLASFVWLASTTPAPALAQPSECRAEKPDDMAIPSYRFAVVDDAGVPVPFLQARGGVVMTQVKWIWSHFDYGWVEAPRNIPIAVTYDARRQEYVTKALAIVRPRFVLDFPTFKPCWERFDWFWVAFSHDDLGSRVWDVKPWDVEPSPARVTRYRIRLPPRGGGTPGASAAAIPVVHKSQ